MSHLKTLFCTLPLIALAACGQQTSSDSETANDYAERIANGGGTEQIAAGNSAAVAPKTAPAGQTTMRSDAVPITRDESACGNLVAAAFIGRQADDATRSELMEKVANSNTRFLMPGNDVVHDPNSGRLNIMLDSTGVIRDVRCG